ncbi:hypothetical protein JL722_7549 [Aureococcus anophagefferens]|nr:hypothetical protein JL722_7549 [Aureococcus anophagefferens]
MPSLTVDGREVIVTLPAAYEKDARATWPTVYVCESDGELSGAFAEAARAGKEAMVGVPGRNWYPEFIVPYASGRAVVGFGEHAPVAALAPPFDAVFGWVLIGSPPAAPAGAENASIHKEGGVFICQGADESEPRRTWAASLFAALARTRGAAARKTVVKVDCTTGEQTQQDAVLAAPAAGLDRLAHDLVPGAAFRDALRPFATRGAAWLAAHHEKPAFGGFGAPPSTPAGQQPGASLFGGGGGATSAFGAAPQTSAFGAPAQASAFGAPAKTPFGAAAPAGGIRRRFGAPRAPSGAPATSAFGGAAGAFGAAAQAAGPGTGNPPYVPTKDNEQQTNGKRTEMVYHCVVSMPQYRGKSFEELRFEDYRAGNKGRGGQPAMGALGGAAAFGQPAAGPGAADVALRGGGGRLRRRARAAGGLFGAAPAPRRSAAWRARGGAGLRAAAPAAGGLFGAAAAPAAPAFGAAPAASGARRVGAPRGASADDVALRRACGRAGLRRRARVGLRRLRRHVVVLRRRARWRALASTSLTPSGGLFGARAALSLFGAPAAPAGGGLFGAAAAPKPAGGLFGAAAPRSAPRPLAAAASAPLPAASSAAARRRRWRDVARRRARAGRRRPLRRACAAGGGLFGAASPPLGAAPTTSSSARRARRPRPRASARRRSAPRPRSAPPAASSAPRARRRRADVRVAGLFGAAAAASPLGGGLGGLAAQPQASPAALSLKTDPYGAGLSNSGLGAAERAAALERRGAALEARLKDVVGVSETAAAGLEERTADRAALMADTRRAATASASTRRAPRALSRRAAPAPAPALLGPPPPPASGLAAPPTLLALSPNGGPPPASARSSTSAAPTSVSLRPPPTASRRSMDDTPGPNRFVSAFGESSRASSTPSQQLDRVFAENGRSPGGGIALSDKPPGDEAAREPSREAGDPLDDDDVNPNAPKLVKVGFVTEPSMATLEKMSDDELAAVHGFAVERPDYGRVEWLGRVDVRGVDLDRDVRICERDGPPELNRAAVVTLHNVGPARPDLASDDDRSKWRKRVEKATKKMGAALVDYDVAARVWKFKTNHF